MLTPAKSSAVDIFTASKTGNLRAVRSCLSSGVDPNSKHRGQTPLMYACECGHADVAAALIQNGANVNATDTYNRTALHLAVKNLHEGCCKELMAAGADTKVESILGGETPEDIVHMRGTIDIVRTVLYFQKTKSVADSPTNNTTATSHTNEGKNENRHEDPKREEKKETPSEKVDEENKDEKNNETMGEEAAVAVPRRAPPPEQDEERRVHTPPVSSK